MVEKKILIVSPNKDLIKSFYKNTLKNLNIPANLKFISLDFEHPEDAAIKNIYRILLNLKSFKTYKSIIIVYPKNDPEYRYSNEEYSALNDLLHSAGLKNGVSIFVTGPNGVLDSTMRFNMQSYLIQVSKN